MIKIDFQDNFECTVVGGKERSSNFCTEYLSIISSFQHYSWNFVLQKINIKLQEWLRFYF